MPNEPRILRLAMWSGPRNISTALMRSWGNRPDTAVVDEPFYAFYLQTTGRDHPGAMEIMTHCETRVQQITQGLTGPVPGNRPVFYQKHMAHHLLPEVDRGWLGQVTNCFLIRDPAEVIPSYIKRNGEPSLEDLGFVQQAAIFDWVCRHTGKTPPVIDARDVLQNPEGILRLLCQAVGVEFDKAMLSWPPGLRDTDGIWAKYWYDEVVKSTSFQSYHPGKERIPERLGEVYQRCRECYERLYQFRLH
jgi:hypothetical protein